MIENKLKLNPGEKLELLKSKSKGTLAETDIYTYSIVNQNGDVRGFVEHTDHTSIKGFKRTQSIVQKDNNGLIVIEECWSD